MSASDEVAMTVARVAERLAQGWSPLPLGRAAVGVDPARRAIARAIVGNGPASLTYLCAKISRDAYRE